MNQPLVSIALCTYNGALFIKEQVDSILQQTYQNIELIILDDRSTDDTAAIVQQIAKADPRIHFFQNESNLGYNLNFNKACGFCKGEYIAIADHDDIWVPEKIQILVDALEKDPHVLLVHGISARFSESKKPSIGSIKLVNYYEGNDPRMFYLVNPISGHNMLFRQKLLELSMPFPKEVYYDWWLVIKACCNGSIAHVHQILVWHRMHAQNATGAAKPKTPFYLQTIANLEYFTAIPEMNLESKQLATELLEQYQVLKTQSFSFPLFILILQNAAFFFAHKRRKLKWISWITHAWKAANAKTNA